MPFAEKLLNEYLDYLEIEKNRSIKTRENYERYLRAFFRSARIRDVADVSERAIRDFRLRLARGKGRGGKPPKRATQSYYAIAIRSFLKFLAKRDYKVPPPEKVELPKLPARSIELVEYRDLERILASPRDGSPRSLRDRAILETLFSTGLRLSELCNLNRYLDLDRGEVSVRGKGEKLRVVFLSERARSAIRRYLEARGDAEEALFVSFTKEGKAMGRISPRAIERLVDTYARKAGVATRVTPHSFRHLFATDLLVNGADLRSVQELLGHANVATTQVYTHLTNRELKEVHRAFHARRRSR